MAQNTMKMYKIETGSSILDRDLLRYADFVSDSERIAQAKAAISVHDIPEEEFDSKIPRHIADLVAHLLLSPPTFYKYYEGAKEESQINLRSLRSIAEENFSGIYDHPLIRARLKKRERQQPKKLGNLAKESRQPTSTEYYIHYAFMQEYIMPMVRMVLIDRDDETLADLSMSWQDLLLLAEQFIDQIAESLEDHQKILNTYNNSELIDTFKQQFQEASAELQATVKTLKTNTEKYLG